MRVQTDKRKVYSDTLNGFPEAGEKNTLHTENRQT